MGGIVIDTLLKNSVPASEIAALARDEKKAAQLKDKGVNIRMGDYDNKLLLNEAMKGIVKVFLVSGTDINKVVSQHRNVVDAAKQAIIGTVNVTTLLN